MLNHTHDPALRSWVASAQAEGGDFPIQNLPHGVFRPRGSSERWRGGVAIGDQILDLSRLMGSGLARPEVLAALRAAQADSLNELMALGPTAWRALRSELSRLLREDAVEQRALASCLWPQDQAEFTLPARIGDYTDFFTSWHHMLNAGRIFQPDAPPLPNFRWLPIAYHGRASTVEVSGAPVLRPRGITRAPGQDAPHLAPVERLDYELELGLWVGPGTRRGEPVPVGQAEGHVFGLSLLNDWSARDVQAFEAMPLGPFLAKNFLTTVSPWVVTLEALAPYRCALPRRADDPPHLPHLAPPDPRSAGIDIQLQALLVPAGQDGPGVTLSRTSFRHGYWSLAQMVAHHTEGGCALRPGDLLGTGTQSGPAEGEQGCLLELTRGGQQPLTLPDGSQRRYLEDGDTLVLRAWCERTGAARIGFGDCRGTVHPAA
ncbi:fumarylacetoacetase [Ideonella sp. 4Y11]|uniref:fumarylacetoacetase n=1 Tax=Ideonella aquatica TaxID=2824119 RepID=A0A941BIE7_9BURK|nr:fumarylacetoacetase [Ideonella aquatica]MBQ0958497.1 fumarylacetoacetase [Ideonella aquatica]